MATKTTKKATTDSKGNQLYLRVEETREHGYFHLRARVCTQHYEAQDSRWQPQGVDDDYSDGLLWSGLRVSCQGDTGTQLAPETYKAVYGFDTEYDCTYSSKVDLRRVARMHKTLTKVSTGLARIDEVRGYVRSYGEYLGRVAEVLGCAGMVFEKDQRAAAISGQRYEWTTVGDGVNRANHRIYLWQQEAVERGQQLQASAEVAS
jgi:hypothetical protein